MQHSLRNVWTCVTVCVYNEAMQTAANSIPAPDGAFDIRSRGVLPAMAGRAGHTLTESTHADCSECAEMVGVAHSTADASGFYMIHKTSDGHTGRVWAYDPGPDA
jgi:hypothetical protein